MYFQMFIRINRGKSLVKRKLLRGCQWLQLLNDVSVCVRQKERRKYVFSIYSTLVSLDDEGFS